MTESAAKIYLPPASLSGKAHVSGRAAYDALCAEAEADYEGFWARLAREFVSWKTPFTKVLDSSEAPFFKWFEDGTLNASYNCLDKQVEAGLGDKVALIFEADDGQVTRVTYSELLAKTCRMANALKAQGVKKGDRVVIYMGMSVEGVVAMRPVRARPRPLWCSVAFGAEPARPPRDTGGDGDTARTTARRHACR